MKTTYKNVKLDGTNEQLNWFWSLTATERQTVARGVKRHGLSKEYDRQKGLMKARLHRMSGCMSKEQYDAFNYIEKKLAAF